MQTFLPYQDFAKSLDCLDKKRCLKQAVEAHQLIKGLQNPETFGWRHHPAFKMWVDYEDALTNYYNICLRINKEKHKINFVKLHELPEKTFWFYPEWLSKEALHNSHRSNLLRKDKVFYSKYSWEVPDNLPYYWPT